METENVNNHLLATHAMTTRPEANENVDNFHFQVVIRLAVKLKIDFFLDIDKRPLASDFCFLLMHNKFE